MNRPNYVPIAKLNKHMILYYNILQRVSTQVTCSFVNTVNHIKLTCCKQIVLPVANQLRSYIANYMSIASYT